MAASMIGGSVLALAMTAQGRSSIETAPRVYAVGAGRSLVVVSTTKRATKPLPRLYVEAKPDMTDPWTGEPIVVPPRTIGLLASDKTDPWTGEPIALPPARGPMQDDAPFDAFGPRPQEAPIAALARRTMADEAPFQ